MIDGLDIVGELVGSCLEAGVEYATSREPADRSVPATIIITGMVVLAAVGGSIWSLFAICRWLS